MFCKHVSFYGIYEVLKSVYCFGPPCKYYLKLIPQTATVLRCAELDDDCEEVSELMATLIVYCL